MSGPEEPLAPAAPRPIPPMKPGTVDIPAGKTPFPLILAAGFAAAVIGSWVVEKSAASAPAPAPAAPAPETTPSAEAAAPTPATPAPTPADEVTGLKGQIEALTKKLDAVPKPDVTAEIKPVQEQLNALAKSVDGMADVPKKLDAMATKLADDDKMMSSLKEEISALKTELASAKDAMKAAPAAATPEPAKPAGVDMAAMTSAVDLFKAGKYADALAAFKALPADDARVLYFTALSSGLSSKVWTGDTEQAALKGAEREKAGSPAKAEIDAALAGLTPAQGKAWLDFFRAKAK